MRQKVSSSIMGTVIAIIAGASVLLWFIMLPWTIKEHKEKQRQEKKSGSIGGIDEAFHPQAKAAEVAREAEREKSSQTTISREAPFPDNKIIIEIRK